MSEIRESLNYEWLSQDPDALLICLGGMRDTLTESNERERIFADSGQVEIPDGLDRLEFMTAAQQDELLHLLSQDHRTSEEIEADRKMWDEVRRAAHEAGGQIIL